MLLTTALLPLLALFLSTPALALTDAEIAAIVDRVVPTYTYRATPDQCPPGTKIVDQRGRTITVKANQKAGLKAPAAPVCVVGATVVGDYPRSWTWEQSKRSGTCDDGISYGTGAGTAAVVGSVVLNCADSIAPPKSPSTTRAMKLLTKHVYSEWNRDDFVENDACLDQTIEDSFANQTWVFISARPGAGNSVNYSATHTVRRSLAYMSCMPDPRGRRDQCQQAGWSTYIPFKWSPCAGRTNIADSIFRIDGPAGQGDIGFKPGVYENAWLVWTGSGRFPGHVPAGLNVITPAEGGLKLWEAAASKWLRQHGCQTNATGEVTGCAMTAVGGPDPVPVPPPPAPPPAPPAAKGFPLALNAGSQRAATTIMVSKPATAVRAMATVTAHDADWPSEGELWINRSGPIPLFPDVAGGNNTVIPVTFEVPVGYLVDGENLLEFRWIETSGYRVDDVTFEVETEAAVDGPDPDDLLSRIDELEAELSGVRAELGDFRDRMERIRELAGE